MNVPVVRNFDWSDIARGWVEVVDDKLIVKMKDGFDPKIYDLQPAYVVKEHTKSGEVTEVELIGLSIVLKPTALAKQQREWFKTTVATHPMYKNNR